MTMMFLAAGFADPPLAATPAAPFSSRLATRIVEASPAVAARARGRSVGGSPTMLPPSRAYPTAWGREQGQPGHTRLPRGATGVRRRGAAECPPCLLYTSPSP